ncbi:DNA helicase-2/ATP-dependent DNA helicase PcrA [Phyllobacterium trifolii]|uniref:DNA 3'-5' helicase II n=1 Tax=Phyllobacterium trifolii TaxID=300193 RepID=A0A839U9N0_9HYPH|nr:UvrD-helicase domain-containing protein [Phyllobacterium trifolii]MBB3147237.1 DNA helicase-2/ATP-dependent DNA helicase PcrA [Phyllobacterium trifolii]
MPLDLSKGQKDVLAAAGHILVRGGPGSGKTTVSILKTGQYAADIRPTQRVLFLSFARATVSRVLEAIAEEKSLTPQARASIEVDTYHSFFWKTLKTHGYLSGLPRKLALLTPPAEAVAVSHITADYKAVSKLSDDEKAERTARINAELSVLAQTKGSICFNQFAPAVADLLEASTRLCSLIAAHYPVIVLDEFQDTNWDQWRVVKALGAHSTLLALADPEQRIFDFIGADPERLNHFVEAFEPKEFDLAGDNHRSKGTEISIFGNDILRGKFSKNAYEGVTFGTFASVEALALAKLKSETLAARTRLIETGRSDWSMAILVPTKKLTRVVSDAFRGPTGKLPAIIHDAAIDMEAAILGANIVAWLMQPKSTADRHIFVQLVADYHRGKNGNEASKTNIEKGASILKAYGRMTDFAARGRPLPATSIMVAMMDVYERALALKLSGDPDADWTAVRLLMENGDCKHLSEIGLETRNVRLLDRGTQLRQALSQDWRTFGEFRNAVAIVRAAFVQEHFSSRLKAERGVFVMNMHKAKGKQFDEVIIFEGWPIRAKGQIVSNSNRIVQQNDLANVGTEARQNFRVSVTRAKQRTTILTPKDNVCVLFSEGD